MTDPTDLSTRAAALSARLGVSRAAAELTLDAHVIDLHIDTLIPPRVWGYDPLRAHGLAVSALGSRWTRNHAEELGELCARVWGGP